MIWPQIRILCTNGIKSATLKVELTSYLPWTIEVVFLKYFKFQVPWTQVLCRPPLLASVWSWSCISCASKTTRETTSNLRKKYSKSFSIRKISRTWFNLLGQSSSTCVNIKKVNWVPKVGLFDLKSSKAVKLLGKEWESANFLNFSTWTKSNWFSGQRSFGSCFVPLQNSFNA